MSIALVSEKPLRKSKDPDLGLARQELARARVVARAWAETVVEAQRTDLAALFAREAIEFFGSQAVSGLYVSKPFVVPAGELDDTALHLARSMGRMAAQLPILEGCHALTGLYTALLPSRKRSAMGAFYTPPALTQRLLDLAEEGGLDWKTARVLDPYPSA